MSAVPAQHASLPDAPCWFCGQPEVLEIGEIWTDSNFQLDTCCQALLESVSAEMDDDPGWGRDLLRRLGAEVLTGHRLRRVSDGQGCHPMLDWQLELRPIRFAQARAFIARHHVHCSPPVTWRFGVSVASGHQVVGVLYGVALSTRLIQHPPASIHESLTYGSDWTDCGGAGRSRSH